MSGELVCSYCGCEIHDNDEVSVVYRGKIKKFVNKTAIGSGTMETGGYELTTYPDTQKMFHAVCKWMKEEKRDG